MSRGHESKIKRLKAQILQLSNQPEFYTLGKMNKGVKEKVDVLSILKDKVKCVMGMVQAYEKELKRKKMQLEMQQREQKLKMQKEHGVGLVGDDELKIRFEKLAGYLEDYKKRLFLSDDVEIKDLSEGVKVVKKQKNYIDVYKNMKSQIDYGYYSKCYGEAQDSHHVARSTKYVVSCGSVCKVGSG